MNDKIENFTIKEIKDWLLGNCFCLPESLNEHELYKSFKDTNKTIEYLARQL
jgi:hypothetical protein